MYVPGSDERKLAKIPQIKADCICLDCEDGVAVNAKDTARHNIRKFLEQKSADYFGDSECSVRLNSLTSGQCTKDLEVILANPPDNYLVPGAIHLPKVDEPEHLDEFAYMFNDVTRSWLKPDSDMRMGLIIFIESARAFLNLPAICKRATQLTEKSCLVPEALVFGSDDFCADIGAMRTKTNDELVYARQHLIVCAKAYGFQAIDLVHIDYKDHVGLKEQSMLGAQMGFTGKQVIHPGQVKIVHEAFAPSHLHVEFAHKLIKQFHEHESSGEGAFNFRGHMIDMPLVRQAENILLLHEKVTKQHETN